MDLKQFTADDQNEFVKGAKEIFGTSERVIVQENAVCAHKK
jgi:hypothetical protein